MINRTLRWGTIGLSLLLIYGVWLATRDAAGIQQEIHTKLENKFGFTTEMVRIQVDGQAIESFSITPEESGILYNAGFREGDIVLSHTKHKFYSLLFNKKGSTETIEIIRGNGVYSTAENKSKIIYLKIPN